MRVLFLGEGELSGPARYLAAVLRHSHIPFDHRADRQSIPASWRQRPYDAFLLSDYRASSFTPQTRAWLMDRVQRGAGFLMIGGWASFTGSVGGYAGTALEELLPVACVPKDDRVNWTSGSVLQPAAGGAAALSKGLNWRQPPVVCGYHRVRVKPGSHTAIEFRDLSFRGGRASLGQPHPALVLGQSGVGRTAAFLTDAAPHWAGGLVDWGRRRVTVSVKRGITAEVGNDYLAFFNRLVRWVANSHP